MLFTPVVPNMSFAKGLFSSSNGSPLWKYIPVPNDSGSTSCPGRNFIDCGMMHVKSCYVVALEVIKVIYVGNM